MSSSILSRRLAVPGLIRLSSSTHNIANRTMATKKQGGSSNNGRDSIGRRLGVKVFGGQEVKAGAIIVRQRGQKFRAGENAGMGKDHTIFAKLSGTVQMTKLPTNKKRNVVHISHEEQPIKLEDSSCAL